MQTVPTVEFTSTRLLTPAKSSPKLSHYHGTDIIGAILYLAAADMSGYNLCPFADSCREGCLVNAGRAAYLPAINRARIRKTREFMQHRDRFMTLLMREIVAIDRKAYREGKRPVIRLNGTSDIQWEKIPVPYGHVTYPNLMTLFPSVTFYDYTKIPNRTTPENYHLTFSLSATNDRHALSELERGRNLAVVFRDQLPDTYAGLPVITGDAHDYRFLDQSGCIVGLKAKGPAKRDTSGFVRDPESTIDPSRTFVPFTIRKVA